MAPLNISLRAFEKADNICPGRHAFVCHNATRERILPNIQNYWLAIVCKETQVPERVLSACPTSGVYSCEKYYPVWLIGRARFLWLQRSDMYYLDDSQEAAFADTDESIDFSNYYALISYQPSDQARLDLFQVDMKLLKDEVECAGEKLRKVQSKKSQEESDNENDDGIFVSQDEKDANDDEQEAESSDCEIFKIPAYTLPKKIGAEPVAKKLKPNLRPAKSRMIGTGSARDTKGTVPGRRKPPKTASSSTTIKPPSSTMSSPPATPAIPISGSSAESSAESPVMIKPEPTDEVDLPPAAAASELVKIFVGAHNVQFTCTKTQLAQSPTLMAYLGTGSHIMHPDLCDVDPRDFGVLVQYLKVEEYTPMLIDEAGIKVNADAMSVEEGVEEKDGIKSAKRITSWRLDGLTTQVQYASELMRSGRLYLLAERFQLAAFKELIFRKISLGLPQRYDVPAVMQLAITIFSRAAVVDSTSEADGQQAGPVQLEEFLVQLIAEDMQMVMKHPRGCGQFWDLVMKGEAKNRSFLERVLKRKLEVVRQVGGEVIKIET